VSRRLDALVNNAGINDGVGLKCSPESLLARCNGICCITPHGPYALPALKQSQDAREHRLKNRGHRAGRNVGLCCSEGAILALTREWAVELLPYGIRVKRRCPGGSDDTAVPAVAQHISRFRRKSCAISLPRYRWANA